MLRGQEERKYSIRKYSIGVVSVLAATMFVVSSHEAQASEKTPTSNAAAQKETLNQPGEQGNAITSHQMQSGKQLDDMHKENGKSGTVTEGKDTLQSSKHQSTQNSKTIRTQNDNQVKQDSERQGSKQSHQNNATNNTERQNDQVQNTHHAERNGSQSTTSQSNDVDKSQPSIPAQKVLPNHDKAAPTSTTPPSNDKTAPKSTKAQDATTDKHPNQQDTHQPAHQIIDAKQDDTVRQSEQKPQVGDLSKHIDGQNSPEKPTDKNTDNKQLIKDALQAPKTRSTTNAAADAKKVRPLKANQVQPLNKYPVVFVHGFLGLVGDNAPALYPNYWGGNKFKVIEELRKQGYNVHQASVSAFGSNYDRAVELYYYIKGGRVDYGAAHAAKYGHERYGKTYKGIMPNWEPGKKVHLVGHSMGGQTIRLMEEFLRNGNKEEIAYHKAHGGEISFMGNKYSNIDLGLTQWGFKQLPNESYIDYIKRVSKSKIWTSDDNAAYDLTLDGSAKLNNMTSMNPNITYTTYTGVSSHTGPLGYENPDLGTFFLMDTTSRIIGHDAREEWRKNDGVVPVISSLHPSNQPFINVTNDEPATRRGIWQVKPIIQGWDHVDFIGVDFLDFKRKGAELANFYTGIINDLLRVEATESKGTQLKAS
ncbi:lipase [Staphylococcus aureus]|nr:lipase [Staphylococcus aureus]